MADEEKDSADPRKGELYNFTDMENFDVYDVGTAGDEWGMKDVLKRAQVLLLKVDKVHKGGLDVTARRALAEAGGLIEAYHEGYATTGNNRLAIVLSELIDHWPGAKEDHDLHPQQLFGLLRDLASMGLTTPGQAIDRNKKYVDESHSHVDSLGR